MKVLLFWIGFAAISLITGGTMICLIHALGRGLRALEMRNWRQRNQRW